MPLPIGSPAKALKSLVAPAWGLVQTARRGRARERFGLSTRSACGHAGPRQNGFSLPCGRGLNGFARGGISGIVARPAGYGREPRVAEKREGGGEGHGPSASRLVC